MDTRVFVGNLAWTVSDEDLATFFQTAGTVTHAEVQRHQDTGRSKGWGLVTFMSPTDASNAVSKLNDSLLQGRPLNVREDRDGPNPRLLEKTVTSMPPRAKSGGKGKGGGGGGGGGGPTALPPQTYSSGAVGTRVYVGNLSWDVSWQDLKDFMACCGQVQRADVMLEPNGRSKGCGIVEYSTAEEATNAINTLNNVDLNGRQVFVREDREESKQVASAGCKVYFGNLSWNTTWQDLKDTARDYGTVLRADVASDGGGKSKGFGFVTFQAAEEAASCIQYLNGTELDGRAIEVRLDKFN